MQYPSRLTTTLVAALCASASLVAQGPEDECAGALPVNLGYNGLFDTTAATTSVPAWSCGSGGLDIWMTYTHTASCGVDITASTCGADFDSVLEVFDGSCGALNLLACNDDGCGSVGGASFLTFTATPGTTYYFRVGSWNSSPGGLTPLELRCDLGLNVAGVAEASPGAGTLGTANALFSDGFDLRWNFDDSLGNFAGAFGAMVINVGVGGSSPYGLTPEIPGFDQVSMISTPMAADPNFFGPFQVGNPDFSVTIPAGLFGAGDTVRVQGLVLDSVNAPGVFPVVPTTNLIEFTYAPLVLCLEDFETVSTGAGSYPAGWATDAASDFPWRAQTGATGSSNTGPSAGAFSGSVYMYCETSSPASMGDTFIMNTAAFPSAGLTTLSFQLSRVGTAIGYLEVRMDDGSGSFPLLLATYAGASPSGLDWDAETIALPATLPTDVQIQFLYRAGPAIGGSGSTFTGDLAIDDFCLN